jgi:hypothetical protein
MSDKKRLSLHSSSKVRDALSKELEKQITSMYTDLSKQIAKEIETLQGKENVSSVLREKYLKDLQSKINAELDRISRVTEKMIESSATKSAEEVVKDNIKFAESLGLTVKGAFQNVPTSIVTRVLSGKLYDSNWTLSKALWVSTKKAKKDINTVIATGIAGNRSAYDIAKDLEKYVNPKALKDWNWSKVYPNTNKKVDYNAQRLARTMVSHAYQQALVESTKNNPFVSGFIWRSAEIHGRTCELCASRNGEFFEKNRLPLDHPNGLCTYEAATENTDVIIDRLANWVNGGKDKELDVYAKILGGARWV